MFSMDLAAGSWRRPTVAGIDRGRGTDLAETRHSPCTGGKAPHGKHQGAVAVGGVAVGGVEEECRRAKRRHDRDRRRRFAGAPRA